MDNKNIIARRVAQMLHDGEVVNLGVGIPQLVANWLPEGVELIVHAENGIIGAGGYSKEGEGDPNVVDAGGMMIDVKPGAQFIISTDSFGAIRGGHIDMTILGAYQVDSKGNLANWCLPNKMGGIGGAMDLVSGAKQVVVAMEHTQKGNPKIVENCTYPLTGAGVVDYIVTEMGFMHVTDEGIVLEEINPNYTVEQVLAATDAKLIVPVNLKAMDIID
ncbi:MAG: 3-oxoacid CoA-transferase subunit B [Clostridia bacterium]|nr:3-oxoacid CoA-transferase subunit B [Clostridia bacterium]